MHFESWSAFWAMGGYAFYVWLAFGVSGLALLLLIVQSVKARRSLQITWQAEQARQQRIAASRARQQQNSKLAEEVD
ncbi:heme exporter protein CcmD [Bowmanella sp. Y26]|uniref:heme exporter protein CcmD n=1 Tax=Bowmanella yangjiangensis TaxID=2811230 RepID=UPI001BDD4886|nr:heme exporter protein CcmD [Bowmanella yangjiangensis]MBT1062688.1 heme exporter protein CcmD [Bowmanella yangjiangensis]